MSDVVADHLKWLDGREDAAFQRGLAKGREEVIQNTTAIMNAKAEARIRELEEALRPLVIAIGRKTHPTWDQYNAACNALRAEPAGGGDQT